MGVFEHPPPPSSAVGRARNLRVEMTLPEKRLWRELRKLDLHIRRQAPIGQYIADFACHAANLVIEIDGRRHDLPEDQLYDLERTTWLESRGYRVLRFRNEDVLADAPGVAAQIAKALPLDGGGLGGGALAMSGGSALIGAGAERDPHLITGSPPPPNPPPSRGRAFYAAHTGGRKYCHGWAASSSKASSNSIRSRPIRAPNCIPTGRPSAVQNIGTLIAGAPATLCSGV